MSEEIERRVENVLRQYHSGDYKEEVIGLLERLGFKEGLTREDLLGINSQIKYDVLTGGVEWILAQIILRRQIFHLTHNDGKEMTLSLLCEDELQLANLYKKSIQSPSKYTSDRMRTIYTTAIEHGETCLQRGYTHQSLFRNLSGAYHERAKLQTGSLSKLDDLNKAIEYRKKEVEIIKTEGSIVNPRVYAYLSILYHLRANSQTHISLKREDLMMSIEYNEINLKNGYKSHGAYSNLADAYYQLARLQWNKKIKKKYLGKAKEYAEVALSVDKRDFVQPLLDLINNELQHK